MKAFMPVFRRAPAPPLNEAGESNRDFFNKHSAGTVPMQYCDRPEVLKHVLRADDATMAWLAGLISRREESGYRRLKANTQYVRAAARWSFGYAGKLEKPNQSMINQVYHDPVLRGIFERELLRGCQMITSDERGRQSAFSIFMHFPYEAKLNMLIAACGVPSEDGSPIVNAISKKFPKSRIIATDISFPHANFRRPPNATFLVHNLISEPLPKEHFDIVHCTHFLYYLADEVQPPVLAKLVRSMKDGGLIVTETEYSKELLEFAAAQGKEISIEHLGL